MKYIRTRRHKWYPLRSNGGESECLYTSQQKRYSNTKNWIFNYKIAPALLKVQGSDLKQNMVAMIQHTLSRHLSTIIFLYSFQAPKRSQSSMQQSSTLVVPKINDHSIFDKQQQFTQCRDNIRLEDSLHHKSETLSWEAFCKKKKKNNGTVCMWHRLLNKTTPWRKQCWPSNNVSSRNSLSSLEVPREKVRVSNQCTLQRQMLIYVHEIFGAGNVPNHFPKQFSARLDLVYKCNNWRQHGHGTDDNVLTATSTAATKRTEIFRHLWQLGRCQSHQHWLEGHLKQPQARPKNSFHV